ncbi:MAG: DUF3306 domain-containing protein [Rhodospirillales bacterium]|nr:DUF3306 domain-containing protein [Rhodospirillales bacterium]
MAEGRFSRWSRLKTETQENVQPELEEPVQAVNLPQGQPDELVPEEVVAPEAPESEEQAAVLPEDLPDIETLEKDSDYTPFLAEGVPEALKKLALRKLWASDPVLANLDGLNDYDEDFTIIEAMKTFVSEGAEKLKEANDKVSESSSGEETTDETEGEESEEEELVEDDEETADENAEVNAADVHLQIPSDDPEKIA